jgi:hypothetical protein
VVFDDPAIVADLKSRVVRYETRRERVEQQLEEIRAALAAEKNARIAAEAREAALRREIEAIESRFQIDDAADGDVPSPGDLSGLTVLYVGGYPARIGHLRALAEEAGAVFLCHDGGIEERGGLLPGLVSRADAVLFPVDCISHAAMLQVKRLCRQAGKKFVPLRTAGLAPFCDALKSRAFAAE